MEDLLRQIIKYYLTSGDFNGIPAYQIAEYKPEMVEPLIRDGNLEAIYNDVNPHIKFFNETAPIEDQIRWLNESHVCFFPTPKALEGASKDAEKRYTSLLQSGEGQFEVRYFDVQVLEQYFGNPQYIILDSGYRGSICLRDEYAKEDEHDYIQNYGVAYPRKKGITDRAVAVFIRDLARLPAKSQMFWASHEIADQGAWQVNGGFIKNLVLGEWETNCWIYDALLEEQKIINQICDAIGIRHIFSKTWDAGQREQIEDYRTILFPTRKNYYSFVNVLEKIVVHNIYEKAFTREQQYTHPVIKENGEGRIALLGKWLKANGRNEQAVDDTVIAPLKDLRKIRQIPAHDLIENEYDLKVYEDQNNLIERIFWSVHCLRIMLGSHPRAKGIQVPDYLDDESRIVIY